MVAAAIGILVIAVLISDGPQLAAVDEVIESVSPNPDDEVLSQVDVAIDLAEGYTAELTVNGIKIPEDQLRRVEALNIVSFRPGANQVIAKLQPEINCVNALYWPVASGRSSARSYQWCFTAS